MAECTFCIPGKETLIQDWPKKERAGLQYLFDNNMIACDLHKAAAEEKLKTMPKVLVVKNGVTREPAAPKPSPKPDPRPVAAARHWTDREPGCDDV